MVESAIGGQFARSANAAEFMRRGDAATAEKPQPSSSGSWQRPDGELLPHLKPLLGSPPAISTEVDVAQAVNSALFLFEQRLRKLNVKMNHQVTQGEWTAFVTKIVCSRYW